MKGSKVLVFCIQVLLSVLFLVITNIEATFTGAKIENENYDEISLSILTPAKAREILTWTVNRNIIGFRIEATAGNPGILEVRIPGRTEKWQINRMIRTGQSIERIFDAPIQVGQMQVEVTGAIGSKLRLIVYVRKTGTGEGQKEEEVVELNMGIMQATQYTQSLVWDVNRKITGLKVISTKGHPSVMEISFPGRSEKWTMHKEINVGQFFEKKLSQPTQVGKIQVNVFKAVNTGLRLIVYVPKAIPDESLKPGEVDMGTLNAINDNPLVWNVNRKITGLRVVSMKGNPSIIQISFPGRTEKWTMHKEISIGQFVERKLTQPVQVGKVQVNVYKAANTRLKLIVYTKEAEEKPAELDMGILTATTQSEKDTLTWSVDRRITGFRLTVKEGRLIINEVRFTPIHQKYNVGQYLGLNQTFEKKFDRPVRINDLQVDVDNARGNKLGLVVFTDKTGQNEREWDEIECETHTFWEDIDQQIWNVDYVIYGFRIESVKGRFTIDEVAFYKGQKWVVNKSFGPGQKFEQMLDEPTEVSRLRIKVRYAKDDSVKLVLYVEPESEFDDAGVESDGGIDEPTGKTEGTKNKGKTGSTDEGTLTPEEELQKAIEELLKGIKF